MPAKRRKMLFYCQSLVGLGHLTSSLLVIRELSAYADVDLIHGGQGLQQMPELPGFRHLRLPTILIDSASDELYAPDSDEPIERIWAERAAAIEQFVNWPYDAVIVEFFPFGRRRLKQEILGLFAKVRQRCGAIPIFCFVREILVPAALDAERRMVKLVREHIHTVFVRGDPNIVRFEETFSLTAEIADRLVYVGYVSPPPPTSWPVRRNRIVVSQGGGEIGKSLLRAAIRTAPLLPEYQFLVITSSRASATEIAELQALVSSPNVQVVSFLHNFQENLQSAALSISLGGDNTLMDVISTRTPALAYPYAGNSEQGLRIEKLAGKGFVFPLTDNDLPPERLSIKIRETINQAYPQQAIAINGAAEISRRIRAILDGDFCEDQ
ncbi:glycosyl transferase [Methylomonas sp. LW13]|uniref:Glycosyltransferase n=1 Tax=Methylomonas defluvii TaxID=3045149 RepID=A0ABU4UGB5_9GAMM|nr:MULTISPECIES: glycosyltransferase [unclassified Methylomonas]MDX8127769.1 glycosyltransferase [Methylomonas sp. OY6]PKD38200.1 glycosyl transferase [Methylomonas sp. Kb3]QBC27947.1 glycosyl transferase [Methylomonas sp. LW13]